MMSVLLVFFLLGILRKCDPSFNSQQQESYSFRFQGQTLGFRLWVLQSFFRDKKRPSLGCKGLGLCGTRNSSSRGLGRFRLRDFTVDFGVKIFRVRGLIRVRVVRGPNP